MRNPFVRAGVVPLDRLEFIEATRGGSAWLWAGGVYWAVAGLGGLLAEQGVWGKIYLYGGFSVPVLGWVLARLQRVQIPAKSPLVLLVAIAATITPFCFPLLILLERRDPGLLPVALTTIDGAHLLVLMWVQLDYAYFLAAVAKGVIGAVFGFALVNQAGMGVGLASSAVSFWAAWSIQHDAARARLVYGPVWESSGGS
jgi:Family of unknown function (DUF7010)